MVLSASRELLTFLPSRSSFVIALELLVTECQSSGEPLALFVIGVDRAPSDAAQQNHDELLPAVAKLLRLVCGRSGLLGHLGDGVFAVLRRGMDQTSSVELAESFRLTVEHNFRSRKHPLTTSVGLARLRPYTRYEAADLLELAEHCCKESREGGGNHAHCETLDPLQPQHLSVRPTGSSS